MDIDALKAYCRPIYEHAPSIIHRWGHIERTTLGAKWFVRILGGSKEEEELALIGGILHDIVRPNTEKVDHAQASADETERVLRKFKFDESKIPLVVQAVRDHRKKPKKWDSALHQSVFLSDKLLEQMGPYVVFRRLVYTGELKDYKELDAEEAIIASWKRALKKTEKQLFPEKFSELYDYQNRWQIEFIDCFEKGEEWAVKMGRRFFQEGREKTKDFERMIPEFKPDTKRGAEFRKEALDYMEGKKFIDYERIIG